MFKNRLGMNSTFVASNKSAVILGLIHVSSFVAVNGIGSILNFSDNLQTALFMAFGLFFIITMQIWVFGGFKSNSLGFKRLFIWFITGGSLLVVLGITSKLFN